MDTSKVTKFVYFDPKSPLQRVSFLIARSEPLSKHELAALLCPQFSVCEPPRSSVLDQDLTGLRLSKETGTFNYNGVLCAHKSSKNTCVVLEALHLRWCRELSTLIDRTANSVVLGTTLNEFLQGRGSIANPDNVMEHIDNSFHVDLSESLEALQARIRGLVVQQPIEGLAEPVVRYKCNICEKWFANIPKHRSRTKDDPNHVNKINYDIKPQYCIPLFNPGSKQSLMVQNSFFVPLDPKYKHRTEELPPSDTVNLSPILTPPSDHPKPLTIPAYVQRLGWERYLSCIEGDPTVFISFHDLASQPGLGSRKSRAKRDPKTPQSKLESFLKRLPKVVANYLSHAIMRVRGAHQGIISLVTEGYGFFPFIAVTWLIASFSTKGTFSLLSGTTVAAYQVPATQALTFALRYVLLDQEHSEQLEKFELMQLKPIWKGGQLELVSGFLDTLLMAEEDLPDESIWKFIHIFFVEAFTSPLSLEQPIDSIVEQGIIFSAFSKYHGWAKASAIINGNLKFWQFIKRCITIHAGFLGSLVTPYSPPPGFQDLAHLLPITPQDGSGELDGDGGDGGGELDRELDDGEYEEGSDDDNDEKEGEVVVEDEFDFSFLESLTINPVGRNGDEDESSISE